MPFEPRLRNEILQEMAALFVARTKLTDLAEGGVAHSILGIFAEELEAIEFRLAAIRDAYDITLAAGTDLDQRVGELPPPGLARQDASPASNSALRVTRETALVPLLIPAGSLFGRSDGDVEYRTTSDVTMAIGELVYPPDSSTPPIPIICNSDGEIGNAPEGAIDQIVSAPTDLLTVSNVVALTNGTDRESDERLRVRALAYLSSLARVQPEAQRYIALSHPYSDGAAIIHASVFEDVQIPGYAELVIDDGSGLEGRTTAGQIVTGDVPIDGNLTSIFHQAPAVEPITQIEIDHGAGFVTVTQVDPTTGELNWTSVEERGVLVIHRPQIFTAGGQWRVANYDVYTNPIAELQAVVEGDPSNPNENPGWRASGNRCKVVPPFVDRVDVIINVVVVLGTDLPQLVVDLKLEIAAFMSQLPPGRPMFLAQLIEHLMVRFDALDNLTIEEPTGDKYPATPRTALRAGTIEVK